MSQENVNLNESYLTLALQVSSIFVSSFPGFIVIGKIQQNHFEKEKYFEFTIFEINKLYLTFVEILAFFTNISEQSSNPKLFHVNEKNEENYFWSGHSISKANESLKLIIIGIEKNDTVVFQLKLYMNELQNLFFCLRKVIVSSLCLKINEKKLIEFLSDQKIDMLKNMQSDPNRVDEFINRFITKNNLSKYSKDIFIEIVKYYFEIVIIMHKLKSLEITEVTSRENIINSLI
jgi:hypothetical protein